MDSSSGSSTPEGATDGTDLYDNLNLDKAEPEAPADAERSVEETRATDDAPFHCAVCEMAITDEYYTLGEVPCCPSCHAQVEGPGAPGSFAAACGIGVAAAVVGAALYWGVARITGYEIGLLAIVVGFLVGKGVRRGAGLRNHWVYRLLGVGLTYLAMVGLYVPEIMSGGELGLVGSILLAQTVPVILLMEGEIMAIIILAIGLWEGWRFSAGPVLSGPFYVRAGNQDPVAD